MLFFYLPASIIFPSKLNSSTASSGNLSSLCPVHSPKHPVCVCVRVWLSSCWLHSLRCLACVCVCFPCWPRSSMRNRNVWFILHGDFLRSQLGQVQLCICRAKHELLKAGLVCPLVSATQRQPWLLVWSTRCPAHWPLCWAGHGPAPLWGPFLSPWTPPGASLSLPQLLHLQLLENWRWGNPMSRGSGCLTLGLSTISVVHSSAHLPSEHLLFIDLHAQPKLSTHTLSGYHSTPQPFQIWIMRKRKDMGGTQSQPVWNALGQNIPCLCREDAHCLVAQWPSHKHFVTGTKNIPSAGGLAVRKGEGLKGKVPGTGEWLDVWNWFPVLWNLSR